jgi:hypothetical protein
MHPRTIEILDYCDREAEQIRSALDAVPADRRDWRPSPTSWSTNDVIAHLAMMERRLAGIFGKVLDEAREAGLRTEADTSPIMPKIDVRRVIDRTTKLNAPDWVNPSVSASVLGWDDFMSSRNAIRDVLVKYDGLALGDVSYPHPILGTLDLYHWFVFIGAHGTRHALQIREIAASMPASGTDSGGTRGTSGA